MLALALFGLGRAAEPSATVTESVDQVVRGSPQAGGTSPAPVGTHVADGEYLKTGVKSRAELQFPDLTITRMGANTIFNYSIAKNEIDLQSGTILFSKPKGGKELDIKTAAVTAAILGTTGFMHYENHVFLFGLIEGHARLTIGGKAYGVGAGQVLHLGGAGAVPQIFAYNVPLLVQTSPFFTQFKSTLPNQAEINQEVADYNDLASRGFIQTHPPFFQNTTYSTPGLPIVAWDSAGNALNQFVNPPPPPPPPPSGMDSGGLVRPAPPGPGP